MQIKPGITADGFRTAVQDYTVSTVIEELGANAYDADSKACLVILDSLNLKLYVLDDGIGFSGDALQTIVVLGGGDKRDVQVSKAKRHYLGSFGYGLKSTLNVASKMTIEYVSTDGHYKAEIDWNKLDRALDPQFHGFPVKKISTKGKKKTGTLITLNLRSPKTKKDLDDFGKALSNLPTDAGKFKCFFGDRASIEKSMKISLSSLGKLRATCARINRNGKISLATTTRESDLQDCDIYEWQDEEYPGVSIKIYFAGWNGDNVKHLKKRLRGVYVRIHGRLLKQNFEGALTYNVSKWMKFTSGVRVELSVPWLRDQITLSREGLRFSNEKIEFDFRKLIERSLSSFIQPQLKKLEKKKARIRKKKQSQRMELARKRARSARGITVKGLKSGFNFIPECDAELALLVAQSSIVKRIKSGYRLIDYNDQAPFDCIFWDSRRSEFVNVELEPDLMAFLGHKDRSGIELIITWTLGKWRVGSRKKSKKGELKLISEKGAGRNGRYKLLEYPSSRSKAPRQTYQVVVLEELIV